MKGDTPYFYPTYNSAGSSDVRAVDTINFFDVSGHKSVPMKSDPDSVTKVTKDGNLLQERYYDENGDIYLDINYTAHRTPGSHPHVPHQHNWNKNKNGVLIRDDGKEIKK